MDRAKDLAFAKIVLNSVLKNMILSADVMEIPMEMGVQLIRMGLT
jgi:hypothetical protein